MDTPLGIINQLLQTKTFLSESQTRDVFLCALHKYFTKTINSHTLESVATLLYYEWNKPFVIETEFERNLAHALLAATEFHYEHTRLEEKKADIFLSIESELRKYYESKKELIRKKL